MSIVRFGEKLKVLRQKQGLTLQSLAEILGYRSHGYISELELGKKQPTVDLVVALARNFDISIDELLLDELELTVNTKRKSLK